MLVSKRPEFGIALIPIIPCVDHPDFEKLNLIRVPEAGGRHEPIEHHKGINVIVYNKR
jgi:hypothetical protein